MKILKILGIIVVSLVVLSCLLWAGYYGYSYYQGHILMNALKQPYIEDAKTSLGSETPMEAYQKFREALEKDDVDTALLYIFESSREKYKEELEKPDRIKIYLNMPEILSEDNVYNCDAESFACLQRADYFYEYEVTGAKKEIDLGNGYVGVHEPGIYKSHINFIKNLAGKWQILDL